MNEPPPVSSSGPPKSSGLAITSLILGILSLTCFLFLSGIPAVICGHLAYSRIKRSGGALTGNGLALAGLITGYIGIGLSLFMIPLMVAIAIPNFVKARNSAMMNACINNLRQIDSAKREWALEKRKDPTDAPTAKDLDAYLKSGGVGIMTCPAGGTYTINSVGEKPTCSISGHRLPE